MADQDWPGRLTSTIATEVRRHRLASNLTVQQLSDELAKLGVSLARPVLSNLENKRRPNISIAEVFAIGVVLGVPPLLLLFPLGREDSIEVAPDSETDPWTAYLWATGSMRIDEMAQAGLPFVGQDGGFKFFDLHQQEVRHVDLAWQALDEARRHLNLILSGQVPTGDDGEPLRGGPTDEDEAMMIVEYRELQLSRTRDALISLRRTIRKYDRIPPTLPDRVSKIVQEDADS